MLAVKVVDILSRPNQKTLPCVVGWLRFEAKTVAEPSLGNTHTSCLWALRKPAGFDFGLNGTSSSAGRRERRTCHTPHPCEWKQPVCKEAVEVFQMRNHGHAFSGSPLCLVLFLLPPLLCLHTGTYSPFNLFKPEQWYCLDKYNYPKYFGPGLKDLLQIKHEYIFLWKTGTDIRIRPDFQPFFGSLLLMGSKMLAPQRVRILRFFTSTLLS